MFEEVVIAVSLLLSPSIWLVYFVVVLLLDCFGVEELINGFSGW